MELRIRRRLIFRDDDEREHHLTILKEPPTRFGCKLYASGSRLVGLLPKRRLNSAIDPTEP